MIVGEKASAKVSRQLALDDVDAISLEPTDVREVERNLLGLGLPLEPGRDETAILVDVKGHF